MKVIENVRVMQQMSESIRLSGKRIALVPTMGALHKGHISLVEIARKNADIVIMSIFVNPLQFGANEDLNRYPRPFEQDVELAEKAGVDFLFHPNATEFYGENYQTYVEVTEISKGFEGAIRPGHFKGVATIVTKLFNTTKPHCAVFGQKDAQQLVLIQRLAKDLNYDIDIIPAPIIREENGLAMSSRNVYLDSEQKKKCSIIYDSLNTIRNILTTQDMVYEPCKLYNNIGEMINAESNFKIEYISLVDDQTFLESNLITSGKNYYLIIAVKKNSIRLIDNIYVST